MSRVQQSRADDKIGEDNDVVIDSHNAACMGSSAFLSESAIHEYFELADFLLGGLYSLHDVSPNRGIILKDLPFTTGQLRKALASSMHVTSIATILFCSFFCVMTSSLYQKWSPYQSDRVFQEITHIIKNGYTSTSFGYPCAHGFLTSAYLPISMTKLILEKIMLCADPFPGARVKYSIGVSITNHLTIFLSNGYYCLPCTNDITFRSPPAGATTYRGIHLNEMNIDVRLLVSSLIGSKPHRKCTKYVVIQVLPPSSPESFCIDFFGNAVGAL